MVGGREVVVGDSVGVTGAAVVAVVSGTATIGIVVGVMAASGVSPSPMLPKAIPAVSRKRPAVTPMTERLKRRPSRHTCSAPTRSPATVTRLRATNLPHSAHRKADSV